MKINRMGSTAWAVATLTAMSALAAAASCGSPEACDGVTFPTASGRVLRVSSQCGTANGTGSATVPFATISAALAAAQTGDTVVVAAGTYTESLDVKAGVNLVGAGATAVRVQPKTGAAIAIKGTGATKISGIGVYNAVGFGIGISEGAEVVLQGVRVEKTVAAAQGTHLGYGVAATGAKSVSLQGCQLVGNSAVGLVSSGSGPISIIDPLFLKNPIASARGAGTVGIIDPLFTPQSQITGNQGGGVAIIDPLFAPTSDASVAALTVSATDIAANGKYGIALYGASATISRTAIRATKGNQGDAADGLIVAPRQTALANAVALAVNVDETSIITGNGRAGVLATGKCDVVVAAEVSLSGRGGVWAQGDTAKMRITKTAVLAQNAMVGVAVTAGATLELTGARVVDTKVVAYVPPAGGTKVDLGDGIGVFGKARGSVRDAVLKGNPRAGVIGHDCAANSSGLPDLQVENTSITGSKYGVVIAGKYSQSNASASAAPKDKGNSYADVANESADEDLAVQESPCDGGKGCPAAP